MSVQRKNGEVRVNTSRYFRVVVLVLVPLILAGIYIVGVQIHTLFRYDQGFFASEYQEVYDSPGAVARALEGALQNGDNQLYAELTGLKQTSQEMLPRPALHFSILVDVDEKGYFHYLFFDMDTMRRDTRYVKEINGRWVSVPQDAYFYLDSGLWMKTFVPITVSWWALLIVIAIMKLLSHFGARSRAAFGW